MREELILVVAPPVSLGDDSPMTHVDRMPVRQALAEFVRDRRARARPEDAGLAAGPRRRTPGLRREEVAQIAGVGLTWYTWFEQGRDIKVSTHFLDRVALALALEPAERLHLFALAQQSPPPLSATDAPPVSDVVRTVLESLPNPAYVRTPRWDVVAWNAAAEAVFAFSTQPPEQRNSLWSVFANPTFRGMMPDWEPDVRAMLAKFRLDHGRAADDPAFARLVGDLSAASPDFRRWWALQDVSGRSEGIKRFRFATGDIISFEHGAFLVEGAPDLRMIVYSPALPGDRAAFAKVLARSGGKTPIANGE